MKYTRRLRNHRSSTYRKKKRGGSRYKYTVPKSNQYEIHGTKYFKLTLEPEAEIIEYINRPNQPQYARVVLRDLTLDKENLKYQQLHTLKAIVKYIIKEEPLNKKKDVIQQILDNIELE
jgi:hypothetical protein